MDELTKVMLGGIQQDVRDIKKSLLGNGDKDGLIIEVDRLKKSRATTNAILWTVFTALVGTGATVLGAMFLR